MEFYSNPDLAAEVSRGPDNAWMKQERFGAMISKEEGGMKSSPR